MSQVLRTSAAETRRYRCFYTPKDRFGTPVATDSGILPSIQVQAASGESATLAAHHLTGCPISNVERLED